MSLPLVSIIIPSLNEEEYIEETLENLRKQTYPNIEIIVCDGDSVDDTVKIAKNYADKVIVQKTNIAQARNLGAENSKGDFLVFVDADTVLDKKWIELGVNVMRKQRNVVCVGGRVLPKIKEMKYRILYKIGWDLLPRIFAKFNCPQFTGVSIMVRRSVFEEIGGFNESMCATEDIDFIFRIRRKGRLVFKSDMISFTSVRRFKQGGFFYWIIRWNMNWFYYLIFRKSSFVSYRLYR